MKLPISWLKNFVSVSSSEKGVDLIAKKLTMAGLEVEGREVVGSDTVLEVNVTPNRGDCLSVLGLAREVAALTGKTLKHPKSAVKQGELRQFSKFKTEKNWKIKKTSKLCSRYQLVVIDGVQVGPSPDWLVERLSSVGLRSINNIVDLTNFVLLEYGQPTHAFDADQISGTTLEVRSAKESEKILLLDGEEYTLSAQDLIIADAQGPVALAGVMGGEASSVSESTHTLLLECAHFDPSTVRKMARKFGLQTDSSYRFERGIDANSNVSLQRLVGLMVELTKGHVRAHIDVGGVPKEKILRFDPASAAKILGGDWPSAQSKKALQALGFGVAPAKGSQWNIRIPTWRHDMDRTEGLVEEIVRFVGLEKVETRFPALKFAPDRQHSIELRLEERTSARHFLRDHGYAETIHFSFGSAEEMKRLDPVFETHLVTLANPLGQEYTVMRPTLLASLLSTLSRHHRHQMPDVRLFELRNRYWKVGEEFLQRLTLSGVASGRRWSTHWSDKDKSADVGYYDVKGLLEGLLKKIGVPFEWSQRPLSDLSPMLHPGKQATLVRKTADQDIELGLMGELHPSLAAYFDFKKPVLVFELDWEALVGLSQTHSRFQLYSEQPLVTRDLAVIVGDDVSVGSIGDLICSQSKVIRSVDFFDLYRGTNIPADKKSVAFSIKMGLNDRTLTEEEILGVMTQVLESLKKNLNAEVRQS